MAAFRLFDQNPVQFDDAATIAASGYYLFYDTGTTTERNVYSTAALSVSLGARVDLDASGRAESDIWLDGEYRVRLYDADDVMIWSRDNVRDVATGGIAVLDPADGTEDQVYSTDGTAAEWRSISEVPSQTGHAGKYLTTDGTVSSWGTVTIPTYTAADLPGGFEDGTANVWDFGTQRQVKGTGTCPTSATTASTVAVVFPAAFSDTPVVVLNATTGPVTGENARCSMQALSITTTGFTASAFAGAEDGGGSLNISSTVPFNYIAWGTKP